MLLCLLLRLLSSFLLLRRMGSSSSKSTAAARDAEITAAFADIFADAMERADWHGARKPTWQQSRDHFVIQMRAGGTATA